MKYVSKIDYDSYFTIDDENRIDNKFWFSIQTATGGTAKSFGNMSIEQLKELKDIINNVIYRGKKYE